VPGGLVSVADQGGVLRLRSASPRCAQHDRPVVSPRPGRQPSAKSKALTAKGAKNAKKLQIPRRVAPRDDKNPVISRQSSASKSLNRKGREDGAGLVFENESGTDAREILCFARDDVGYGRPGLEAAEMAAAASGGVTT
jgi:hypothetical protein